jgi:GNAT superfamily N-acetyltransferase
MLTLRPARVCEADDLTELCVRSKAVWGYDASFMDACRAELAMTPEKIEASHVQVAELNGKIAGVARLCFADGSAELAALFVEPAVQRSGIGRALFDWAVAECRAHKVSTMAIEADPGAAPFYRRMGARDVGSVPSGSIPGRVLPKLELGLGG